MNEITNKKMNELEYPSMQKNKNYSAYNIFKLSDI